MFVAINDFLMSGTLTAKEGRMPRRTFINFLLWDILLMALIKTKFIVIEIFGVIINFLKNRDTLK